MKNKKSIILIILVLFLLISCGKKSYVVFNYNCNGMDYHKCELKNNKLNCNVETPTCGEYKFKGWYRANEYTNPIDLNGTFNKNEIIYARWEKGNGQIEPSSSEEPTSTIVTPGIIDISSSSSEMPSSSKEEPSSSRQQPVDPPKPEETYTISFNLNGGTGGQTTPISGVKYNNDLPSINQNKPTKPGYTFQGWYDNQNGGTQYYNSSNSPVRKYDKKSNITLYAQWKINTLSIQYNGNGGLWNSTNSTYGVNGSNTVIVKSTNQVYKQVLNYGAKLESSGLVDYNGSWFKWRKDGYITEKGKEYFLKNGSITTALNQSKSYSAVELSRYAGCDLSKTNCTITVKVNWKQGGYSSVDYSKFVWTYYDRYQGPLNSYYSESYPYALWAPKDKDDLNGVSLPLIIWLHGAGEMREHNCLADCFFTNGLPPIITNWSTTGLSQIPAIIFAPQLDATDWWDERAGLSVRKGIDYLKDAYNIDKKKVVLMGHSSGGSGVVYISSKNQDLFSHLVIMSGFAGFNAYKDYYKKIPMKGYMTSNPERAPYGDGNCGMERAFENIGRSSDLYQFPKKVSHVDVPKETLILDENKDGVSDLMYWLFGEDAKVKK